LEWASLLLGVDDAVSVRVQSVTNMKNRESWGFQFGFVKRATV
jgi:hypothetical protein